METKTTVPFYLKLCCIGILIYLVCVLILKAQDILIPLAFAILLSIALKLGVEIRLGTTVTDLTQYDDHVADGAGDTEYTAGWLSSSESESVL